MAVRGYHRMLSAADSGDGGLAPRRDGHAVDLDAQPHALLHAPGPAAAGALCAAFDRVNRTLRTRDPPDLLAILFLVWMKWHFNMLV